MICPVCGLGLRPRCQDHQPPALRQPRADATRASSHRGSAPGASEPPQIVRGYN